MTPTTFHFYGEVNDFLPPARRDVTFNFTFEAVSWSTKDLIESFGVPHTEIGALVINDTGVDLDSVVKPGDTVQVYDHHITPDVSPHIPLRPVYPHRPRFVLDTHLGRVAGYLRLLGFNTLYRNDYPDEELAQISHDETRILLTRDVGLLKRRLVIYGRWVRATDPREKLTEVMHHYDLYPQIQPFTICMRCNGALQQVEKAKIRDQLEARTAQYYDVFHQCVACGQIYWQGSHYENLLAFVREHRQA